jgi:DNA-binding HxlR family transcriptional regulator
MTQGSYRQFCPVAMASEVLCTRWTLLILREMVAGSRRFNDLRRGVPRMSPALLSQRLKELEEAGVIVRRTIRSEAGAYEYELTAAGREVQPIVEAVGVWGKRWVSSDLTLDNLDAQLLMWDMRRNLDTTPMPKARSTVHFQFADAPAAQRSWWLIVQPGEPVDLCSVDPGYDVDLYVASSLKVMTAIWLGYETVRAAVRDERVKLTGDRQLASNMQSWLGLSPFAKQKQMVA